MPKPAKKEMPVCIESASDLQQLFLQLHKLRKAGKLQGLKRQALTPVDKILVLKKTDGRCHVCGQELDSTYFDADHVKAYTMGGLCLPDNFLPACKTCNNYRWHYLPVEIQYILKLGVWARAEVERQTKIGTVIAEKFVKKEQVRQKRVKPGD